VPLRYFLAPLVAVLIWSGNMVINKLAADAIAPSAIAFYRWALAIMVMTPVIAPRVWRARAQIRPMLGKLAVLGLLGLAAWQGLAYYAALTTTATNMGIIAAMLPLVTIVLSALVLRETPTLGMVLGCALAFGGLMILLSHGNPANVLKDGVNIGDLLMLMACISYGFYGILLRRWKLVIDPWVSLYVQACFATLALLPPFLVGPWSPITAQNVWLVLYAAIPVSLGSTFLWMRAIAQLGANRSSIMVNLMPPMSALMAFIFIGERLQSYHVIGGLVTIAGVVLSQLLTRRLGGAQPVQTP
jgi:drug/metabolite transporter (DMT)-like permease